MHAESYFEHEHPRGSPFKGWYATEAKLREALQMMAFSVQVQSNLGKEGRPVQLTFASHERTLMAA